MSIKYSTLRTAKQYLSMPWKNGAGTTIELLKLQLPNHDDFLWRISMATVSENGLFSTFKNIDRTLVLLAGKGITLEHTDVSDHTLSELLQYAQFSGDSRTTARLHDGPITDLNIMTRRGSCVAVTHCGKGSKNIKLKLGTAVLLIYAVQGDIRVGDAVGNTDNIPHNSLLVVEPPPEQSIQIDGAAFVAVAITESSKPL